MGSWLVLAWALTVGYSPMNYQGLTPINDPLTGLVTESNGSFEQTIELSATVADHVRISADIITYDNIESLTVFAPFQSNYDIKAELYAPHVALGIKHTCIHPTLSFVGQQVLYGAMYTEVYVKFSGSTR
jgi:hypothetical protein